MSSEAYTEQQRERVERQPVRRELDARREGGIEVVIYWVKKSNLCLVSLTELDADRAVEFAVEPENVADALQHPYYYKEVAGAVFDDGVDCG